jgi:protoheme IX farnesyltransferase
MAIAWIYRGQYAAAGLRMTSVVDPSGYRAANQAVVAAILLVPVSLVPCLQRPGAEMYFLWAVAMGLGQLACAVGFFVQLSDASARRLLLASLVYLPAIMGLLVLGPLA